MRDALVLVLVRVVGVVCGEGSKSVRLWYQYCISNSGCWGELVSLQAGIVEERGGG